MKKEKEKRKEIKEKNIARKRKRKRKKKEKNRRKLTATAGGKKKRNIKRNKRRRKEKKEKRKKKEIKKKAYLPHARAANLAWESSDDVSGRSDWKISGPKAHPIGHHRVMHWPLILIRRTASSICRRRTPLVKPDLTTLRWHSSPPFSHKLRQTLRRAFPVMFLTFGEF